MNDLKKKSSEGHKTGSLGVEADLSTGRKNAVEAEGPVVFGSGAHSKKLDTPMKKLERMHENIQARVEEIHSMAAKMSEKERADIKKEELTDISDENVKLFVEIKTYTDMLMEMKDDVNKLFPGTGKEADKSRKEFSDSVKKLLDEMKGSGTATNKTMAELGASKDLGVKKMPIFIHEMRELHNDMDGLGDSESSLYKRALSKKLGENVITLEKGDGDAGLGESAYNTHVELVSKLNESSIKLLGRYDEEYPDASQLVIGRLAAIGVEFGRYGMRSKEEADRQEELAMSPLVFGAE